MFTNYEHKLFLYVYHLIEVIELVQLKEKAWKKKQIQASKKLELIQLQNESLDRISHHISLEGNTSTEPLEKYLLEKNGKPINIMVIT